MQELEGLLQLNSGHGGSSHCDTIHDETKKSECLLKEKEEKEDHER